MSDLISRQAAIDVTWEEPTYTDTLNVLTEVRDKIRALPSAQPEQHWIPCSERLPQWWWINPEADEKERIWDGEKVIVCGTIGDWPYSGVACGMYGPDGWSIEDDAFSDDDVPVAWMPIPEPYRAERKEE